MEEEVYKKIEAYLSGCMSKEEIRQFELDMENQEDLRGEVNLYASINHHLAENEYDDPIPNSEYKNKIDAYLETEEASELEKKLLRIKKEYIETFEETKPKTKTRPLYYLMSVAAAGLLFFGILSTNNSTLDVYNDYYKTSELPSFTSRSDKASLLTTASNAFQEGDIDNSLIDFQKYIAQEDDVNALVYIYTGLIYTEKGNLEEAIIQYDFLEKSQSLDNSRALWYKALTYLKFEKPKVAKGVLSTILENPSNYKYKEAKELLDKL